MKPGNTSKGDQNAKNIGMLGLGLCVACCVAPIVGLVGGTGLAAFASVYAGEIAVALLIFGVGIFAIRQYIKKVAPACAVDCECRQTNRATAQGDK